MKKPIVSIVMPMKNAALYIEACITSIIDQSYEHWVLLVVNDHSTDDSATLVSSFAQSDPRIRLCDNTGEGIISALQTGYAQTSGEFVTRMDADDLMPRMKLAQMVAELLHHGTGHIATGHVHYFKENDTLGNGYRKYQNWLNKLTTLGNSWKEIYKECVIPSPCWMVYSADFEALGGFHSDIYPEDYDLCFRFYQYGLTCIPTKDIRHHWRDHGDRASRNDPNYSDNRFLDIKCHYFLELDYDPSKTLVIWGAGKKGKAIAKYFIDQGIQIRWLCDNPKKIGKDIYGVTLEDSQRCGTIAEAQIVIAVANPDEQNKINKMLEQMTLQSGQDYFFFC